MNFNTMTHGSLALSVEAPQLSVVNKPQIGSIVSFRHGHQNIAAPIVGLLSQAGRSYFLVPNPFPTPEPFFKLSAHSFTIENISEPKPLEAKQHWLVLAHQLAIKATMYKTLANRHKSVLFSAITIAPAKTRHGYGNHDLIEQDLIEGDSAKYERRMAKYHELIAQYEYAIAAYKGA